MALNRPVLAWAFYDWANSAFATTVMAGFFPVFFKTYWAAEQSATHSTFWLGLANSVASLLIVILAPVLGAIADQAGRRKRFLLFFTFLGIAMTSCLYLVEKGQWVFAVVIYVLAVVGYSGSNSFYDSLIVNVTDDANVDRVSSFGFGIGYLGGGLLFALNVLLALNPHWVGFSSEAEVIRFSFISVAVWWSVFCVPIFLFVHEPRDTRDQPVGQVIRRGLRRLLRTARHIRQLRMTLLFLVAYWLYIDGVGTVIRMAVDYGAALGFNTNNLIKALLLTQFVGFPAAIAYGYLGERIGAKNGILLAIGVYLGIIVWAAQMDKSWEFYGIAVAIGLVQGGIQALSRSYFARLVPDGHAGEFFGFFNMLGKFAAVIGPLMMGVVSLVSGDIRASVLVLSVLFVSGAILLLRVDDKAAYRAAREFTAARD